MSLAESLEDLLLLALKTPSLAIPLANLNYFLLNHMVLLHTNLRPFLRRNSINFLLGLNFLSFNQHALLLKLFHFSFLLLLPQLGDFVLLFLNLSCLIEFELVKIHFSLGCNGSLSRHNRCLLSRKN